MTPIFITTVQQSINEARIQAVNAYLHLWSSFWRLQVASVGPRGRPVSIVPDPTIPYGPQDQILLWGTQAQWFLGYAATAQATLSQQSPDQTVPSVPAGYRFGDSDGSATLPGDGTAFLQRSTDGTTWACVALSAAAKVVATANGIPIPTLLA